MPNHRPGRVSTGPVRASSVAAERADHEQAWKSRSRWSRMPTTPASRIEASRSRVCGEARTSVASARASWGALDLAPVAASAFWRSRKKRKPVNDREKTTTSVTTTEGHRRGGERLGPRTIPFARHGPASRRRGTFRGQPIVRLASRSWWTTALDRPTTAPRPAQFPDNAGRRCGAHPRLPAADAATGVDRSLEPWAPQPPRRWSSRRRRHRHVDRLRARLCGPRSPARSWTPHPAAVRHGLRRGCSRGRRRWRPERRRCWPTSARRRTLWPEFARRLQPRAPATSATPRPDHSSSGSAQATRVRQPASRRWRRSRASTSRRSRASRSALEPNPRSSGGLRAGWSLPGDHSVDNRRLIEGLVASIKSLGVTILEDRCVASGSRSRPRCDARSSTKATSSRTGS